MSLGLHCSAVFIIYHVYDVVFVLIRDLFSNMEKVKYTHCICVKKHHVSLHRCFLPISQMLLLLLRESFLFFDIITCNFFHGSTMLMQNSFDVSYLWFLRTQFTAIFYANKIQFVDVLTRTVSILPPITLKCCYFLHLCLQTNIFR